MEKIHEILVPLLTEVLINKFLKRIGTEDEIGCLIPFVKNPSHQCSKNNILNSNSEETLKTLVKLNILIEFPPEHPNPIYYLSDKAKEELKNNIFKPVESINNYALRTQKE